MKSKRIRAVCPAGAVLAIAAFSIGAVSAQTYPVKPPRLVVPYVAGGVADFMARSVADGMQEPLKSSVIVDNRGGAGGNVGIDHVAKSAPDGYTLGLGCLGYVSNAVLQSRITYDPVKDFVPIGMLGYSPQVVVVHPSLPVRTLKEFIALARQRPNDLAFGTSGPGGGSHLSVELFKAATNTQMTHIPYKGTAQANIDLLAGRIQFMFDFLNTSMPHIKAGKLRALAITSAKRVDAMPDVPTVAEAGVKGYEFGTWCGIIAPAGVTPAIAERLNASLNKALESPAVKNRLAQQEIQVQPMSQEQFATFIRADTERWKKLLREGRLSMIE